MRYSPIRFVASFGIFSVAVGLLVFLVLSSQVSMAALPAVGVGGIFLQADTFEGEEAVAYPQYGQLTDEYPDRTTDTAACKQRPMLGIRLQNANVDGYTIYKDVKLPYFQNQWMSITIDQPFGAIESNGGTVEVFTTQLEADSLNLDNVRISEGTSNDKWGPQSGEFLLEGDPGGDVSGNDLSVQNVKIWVHAIVADQVNFFSPNGITLNVQYNSTSDIHDRYDNIGILNNVDNTQRENYFDCLPAQPELRGSPLISEDFESGSVPGTWKTNDNGGNGQVVVNTDTSSSGSYSAKLTGDGAVLQTPNRSITNEVGLSVNYWVRQGDGSFTNDDPDIEEYLIVEFRDERGEWNEVDTFEGDASGSGGKEFKSGFTLPDGGYHDSFALRFRTVQDGGSSDQDPWHVDDVELG